MNEFTDNYYNELPEDYEEAYKIDAKNKSTAIYFTLLSFGIAGLVFLILFAIKGFNIEINLRSLETLIAYFIFIISIIAYLVLHELTHGLFYKIYTKEKLSFGMTITVAYCGIPSIYVKKKPMIVTILAPLVVFSIIGIVGLILTYSNPLYYLFTTVLFSLHIGGCIGDIYGALVMIFKFKGKELLVNDTGPCQTFYTKKED